MNTYIEEKQEEFQKAIDYFKKDIATLRTGRANPAMLEEVAVEAYGYKNPLNTVGNISVADSRTMTVVPWDKNIMKEVEKGIVEANLGVSVANEGDKVRVTLPQMTEENRKELAKKLNEKMEKARISVRQTRDEVKQSIEDAEKNKDITEDDKYRFIEELDKHVEKINQELKEIKDKKEEDIMTV